ncbi:MAG: sigma-70 family RNA polymerase sigma factor [Carboxylicivirga sp.]|nr:sigma-70 family RNA polymerase sigma factor [Carboxylicivirga sp.]
MEKINKDILLSRIAKSDQLALNELIDLYGVRLKEFSMTIVKDGSLVDEVVMDVFLKIWEKRVDIASVKNIETYLFVLTRNLSLNVIRDNKKHFFETIEESEIVIAKYEHTAEDGIISSEMLNELNKATEELPKQCKLVFKLIREEKLSREQAAEVLDISIKTIDRHLGIAVSRIAEALNIDITTRNQKGKMLNILLTL